jgi:hypothetical protein
VRRETRRRFPLLVANRTFRELQLFLTAADTAAAANVGVPLASASTFPALRHPDVLTSSTDASFVNLPGLRDDGVGGFGWLPRSPEHVFLVSERWPPRIRQALLNGARTRADKAAEPRADNFHMPGAELFGNWAIPYAIRHGEGVERAEGKQPAPYRGSSGFSHLASVGDCDPAALGMRKGRSSRPQLNQLHLAIRALTESVLAVTVPRDFNFDADRLSHPSQLEQVVRDAQLAGYTPVVLPIPQACWSAVEGWLQLDGEGEHEE